MSFYLKIGVIFAAAALSGCAARPIIVNTECTNASSTGGIIPINKVTQDFECISRRDAALIIETGEKLGDVSMVAYGLAIQRKLDGEFDETAEQTNQDVYEAMNRLSKPMDCEVVGTEEKDGKTHKIFGNCKISQP